MRMSFSRAFLGTDLCVYTYIIQLFPNCLFSCLGFFFFSLPFFSVHITICSGSPLMWLFKLLSLSKVNWLLGKKKKKKERKKKTNNNLVVGNASGLDSLIWLSISIWIGERQLSMSEEEEVLWETSARHLSFRCFFSQNFLTHLIADPRGFSEQAFFFQIHTAVGAFFCYSSRIFGTAICTVIFEELRLQAGKKIHDNFILC